VLNVGPQVIRPVGFEPDEGMLPYGPRSFPGYALLTEYFAFPQKFLFFDIEGLEGLRRLPLRQDVELVLFLDRTAPALETRVSAETFRLHCVPIVNLFSRLAEPIRLTRTRSEYLVVPDARRPDGMEVISIQSVESVHPDTKQTVTYAPFYALDRADDPQMPLAYWHARRRPSLVDSGTDVYLTLVDRYFQPQWPPTEVLSVRALCSNRNWPGDLQKTGTVDWQFQLAGQFPVRRITTPVEPTPSLRLPEGDHRWRLISHLLLNHLSLTGGPDGAAALRQILRLYDYAGSSTVAQQIEGIAAVESSRGVAPIREGPVRGFCRGLDVTITFDDDKYPGTGFFLLASVLERFLAQYASINAFTRLTARSRQRAHWERRWPPRTGNLTLA
jgi:type VI secretion system protein ImpG